MLPAQQRLSATMVVGQIEDGQIGGAELFRARRDVQIGLSVTTLTTLPPIGVVHDALSTGRLRHGQRDVGFADNLFGTLQA
jgi:hypothetical protein